MMVFINLSREAKNIVIAVIAMVIILVVSNYLVTFQINPWLTYAAFTYPLVFLVVDLANRALGAQNSRRIAWIALPFAGLISWHFANGQIAIASATAFILSQLFDISVFNYLRNRSWWLAPWCGSMLASVLDTFCFFGIAFYDYHNPNWYQTALQLGTGDLLIKWFMAVILLLPYRIVIPRITYWQVR